MDHSLALVLAVVCLAIGVGIGFIWGHFMPDAKQKTEKLEADLANKDIELQAYKDNVANHFNETASLVNSMTESYKAVYAHLAKSSHDLIDDERLARIAKLDDEAQHKALRHINAPQESAEDSQNNVEGSPAKQESDAESVNLSVDPAVANSVADESSRANAS